VLPRLDKSAQEELIKSLAAQDWSCREIEPVAGVHYSTVSRVLNPPPPQDTGKAEAERHELKKRFENDMRDVDRLLGSAAYTTEFGLTEEQVFEVKAHFTSYWLPERDEFWSDATADIVMEKLGIDRALAELALAERLDTLAKEDATAAAADAAYEDEQADRAASAATNADAAAWTAAAAAKTAEPERASKTVFDAWAAADRISVDVDAFTVLVDSLAVPAAIAAGIIAAVDDPAAGEQEEAAEDAGVHDYISGGLARAVNRLVAEIIADPKVVLTYECAEDERPLTDVLIETCRELNDAGVPWSHLSRQYGITLETLMGGCEFCDDCGVCQCGKHGA
jgi:hypothetical protein